MSTKIIDGKKIADKILADLKLKIKRFAKSRPKLTVICVGSYKPSMAYISRKRETAKKVGILFDLRRYPAKTTNVRLAREIKKIQKDKLLSGLILQLPLPKHLNAEKLINCIWPELDVDCLTSVNTKTLGRKNAKILMPPTPAAILEILRRLKVSFKTAKFTVVGLGKLVGRPLVEILRARGANVLTCDKNTKDAKDRCLRADVLITAVGRRNLIKADMVKRGATVIDAGISFHNHKMYGDADFDAVSKKAGRITPVPGGVGPITVAMLLKNVYEAHHRHSNI